MGPGTYFAIAAIYAAIAAIVLGAKAHIDGRRADDVVLDLLLFCFMGAIIWPLAVCLMVGKGLGKLIETVRR